MAHTFEIQSSMKIWQKVRQINWGLLALLTAIAGVGWLALYSAAGGSLDPWASRQMVRFAAGIGVLVFVALVDIRLWYRLAYPIYGVTLVLLVIVDVMGHVGMGAQRWINLGFIQIQPSEIMKMAVVMALARYFHAASVDEVRRIFFLIPPAVMIALPVALVMWQPDLGTSLMITMGGIGVIFLAGAPLWIFLTGGGLVLAALPVAWTLMHDYQRRRVITFLNPENDPLGAGYHTIQATIALGSGGLSGKGWLNGTQSQLDFLPERHTDFIFAVFGEEFGLIGNLLLLLLFAVIIGRGLMIAANGPNPFCRLLAGSISITFFTYAFVNMGMVSGILPVVGVPLPMISYGGTSLVTLMIGFGILMSIQTHKKLVQT